MITDINQLDPDKLYTYADYLTWRFTEMVELIKGKLFILSPAPAERHQRIVTNMNTEVLPFFKHNQCKAYTAPFDVRLPNTSKADTSTFTVVQPDICVISNGSKIDEKGCVGAPDWIIEIISPSTAKRDFDYKYTLYEENGVREYWIINPDAFCIHQYFLTENKNYEEKGIYIKKGTITPHIFPELTINVQDIFI
jgi:Uma2 family endonuclease